MCSPGKIRSTLCSQSARTLHNQSACTPPSTVSPTRLVHYTIWAASSTVMLAHSKAPRGQAGSCILPPASQWVCFLTSQHPICSAASELACSPHNHSTNSARLHMQGSMARFQPCTRPGVLQHMQLSVLPPSVAPCARCHASCCWVGACLVHPTIQAPHVMPCARLGICCTCGHSTCAGMAQGTGWRSSVDTLVGEAEGRRTATRCSLADGDGGHAQVGGRLGAASDTAPC
jgi:hypothetical protein